MMAIIKRQKFGVYTAQALVAFKGAACKGANERLNFCCSQIPGGLSFNKL